MELTIYHLDCQAEIASITAIKELPDEKVPKYITLPIGLLDWCEQHECFPCLISRSCVYIPSSSICCEIMNIGPLSPEMGLEKITPVWLPNLLCKCAYQCYFVSPWCFIKHLFSQTRWSIKCLESKKAQNKLQSCAKNCNTISVLKDNRSVSWDSSKLFQALRNCRDPDSSL